MYCNTSHVHPVIFFTCNSAFNTHHNTVEFSIELFYVLLASAISQNHQIIYDDELCT